MVFEIDTPPSIPTAVRGEAFTLTLTTTDEQAPVVFSVQSGALPPGLSLSSTGTITGEAKATAILKAYNAVIHAIDFGENEDTLALAITVGRNTKSSKVLMTAPKGFALGRRFRGARFV